MSNRKLDDNVIEKDSFLDIALRTRETLKDPKDWCQNVTTNLKEQHCLIGHVELVVGDFFSHCGTSYEQAKKLFRKMGVYEDVVPGGAMSGAVNHNNHHTHAEVLELFDKGIENLIEKHAREEN